MQRPWGSRDSICSRTERRPVCQSWEDTRVKWQTGMLMGWRVISSQLPSTGDPLWTQYVGSDGHHESQSHEHPEQSEFPGWNPSKQPRKWKRFSYEKIKIDCWQCVHLQNLWEWITNWNILKTIPLGRACFLYLPSVMISEKPQKDIKALGGRVGELLR